MLDISSLASLLNLNTKPNEIKNIIKLITIDVLKSLGNNKYLIKTENGKELVAKSSVQLEKNTTYLAKYTLKENVSVITNLVKIPKLYNELKMLNNIKNLNEILNTISKTNGLKNIKQQLLNDMLNTNTKEHFQSFSHILLSLNYNILTIPFLHHEYFGFIQIKKRYNKKTKKTFVDFYAMYEKLGIVSGVLSVNEQNIIDANIYVPNEIVKNILEKSKHELNFGVSIVIKQDIKPLYDITSSQNILDISI